MTDEKSTTGGSDYDKYRELFEKESFELRLSDDSLHDSGVREGWAVRFRRSSFFHDGDLIAVVAPCGLLATFAYYEPGGVVRLEGAHPQYRVKRYLRRALKVLGVAWPFEGEKSESAEEGPRSRARARAAYRAKLREYGRFLKSLEPDEPELEWPEYIDDGRTA